MTKRSIAETDTDTDTNYNIFGPEGEGSKEIKNSTGQGAHRFGVTPACVGSWPGKIWVICNFWLDHVFDRNAARAPPRLFEALVASTCII